ncbi:Holocytochrome c synthase/heme-lyase [Ceraceosorus bombacis]|uniref:Holocytochrome c-type synthase n=1 Tax=Ceraceosorus bombacis TaxID=401625 RepID=A0A0P1BF41_9BASI|nr:Holocytochrome c synthase/heme-lyase [Ceraceosorus bombacis]
MWPFRSGGQTADGAPASTSASAIRNDSPASPPYSSADACPMDHSARDAWLKQSRREGNSSAGPEAARPPAASSLSGMLSSLLPTSKSSATERKETPSFRADRHDSSLSVERVVSSIPRLSSSGSSWLEGRSDTSGQNACPVAHDATASTSKGKDSSGQSAQAEDANWVYPSPAQFFAAMARKNQNPNAADMDIVVPIHNAVNERAWNEILKWEQGWDPASKDKCGGPKLVTFKGKPGELTWKAWARGLAGYSAPFDRHDWEVDRCGHRVRYIIDFYSGPRAKDGRASLSFFLDVRPAPDTLHGWLMRGHRALFRPD